MAYNAYLVSGNVNKDHVLPLSDFVPKWQVPEEDASEVNEDHLRTKVVAAFGAAFAEAPTSASRRTSG